MKKFITLVFALVFATSVLSAQETSADSIAKTPREAFQKGHHAGAFRTFFMATDNTRNFSDYYALAAGGSLHFNTAIFHGFQFGLGGMFNFKLAGSDLSLTDSVSGAKNRYEIGLFDVENPYNTRNLDRMEEFWLKYSFRKSSIKVGQQQLQTPFINYQDGRMRPTAEAAAWLEINDIKKVKIEGGWIWRISPRSTVRWFGIGESIGLYPKGLNPDGTASGYPENISSQGIGVLGITRQFQQHLKVQFWNQYVENVFHTAFVQADWTKPIRPGNNLIAGLQFTHQNAVKNGGNVVEKQSYFTKNGQSNILSTQAGWQHYRWQFTTAFTHITNEGRFLSPREWGREPFYTFMPRERVEGSGGVNAATVRVNWNTKDKQWQLSTGYGHFYLQEVSNYTLNKYAFPAYKQFNFDVRYAFGGMLKGLKGQFLYVYKGRLDDTVVGDKSIINKVNVSLYNLVLNYTY